MEIQLRTQRFGILRMVKDDVICFPNGFIGMEAWRHWVLLADAENDALGWLQSTTHPDIALGVISPRRFIPHYRVRVAKQELAAIELDRLEQAYVLNVVSLNHGCLTANLRAPLIFNLERRLGRQVVTSDEQPLQWELALPCLKTRKSA